ncbi:hypothetical protein [Streptomyces sp. NPDC059783]|uniref:hypothetical protein n=1 Tax=Streptomyces sp. NPDC059783 TaxID=3346944 RepID=UPI00365706AC
MTAPAVIDTATDLDNTIDDLTGCTWLAGVSQILTGLRQAQDAITRGDLSLDATQSLIAVLAGADGVDIVTAIGQLIAHAAGADTNPVLRTLTREQQKNTQHQGELALFDLAHPSVHQAAANAAAAISHY